MELTGAQIVIECLKEQGVDTVFGYPGGAILNVYDELYKHRDEITHYLTSHEQGASHAADGYARATGKVGVCFATSGPGATNMVTGIATAYMDSVPVVMITCNVGLNLLGKDSFQEIDILGITMPVTKYNFIVKDVTKLADVIRRAFRIAQTGRPGPVVVDITKDVTAKKTEYTYKKPEPITPDATLIDEADVEKAVTMIAHSERPFVFVGGGVTLANASEELRRFVKKIDAPVADSLMGKGAFDGTDDSYVGMLGMHGTKAVSYTHLDVYKRQTVAFPHLPENTHPIDEVGDIAIDQVVIGSCTNGRLEDLRIAAEIMKGRKIAKGLRVIIIPATQKIYLDAMEAGYIKAFIEAGAIVSTPTCGPCLGGYMGILAEGEKCVSTTNRNFVGRMGHVTSEIYLASPAVAAASAITGKISCPCELD